jgi:hypothetical protein
MCSIMRLFFWKQKLIMSLEVLSHLIREREIASDVQKKCSLELRGCS